MTKVLLTESYLDDIADAIREKRGVLTEYKPSQMAGAIMDIDTHDTHDATASAGDVLTGKTAYIATGKVSGTMPNQGAIAGTIDAENPSYTVPEGYHSGLGTVSADVATTAEVEAYVGRIKKLMPKTITENGTYKAEDDNVGGYSQVTVNVSGGIIDPGILYKAPNFNTRINIPPGQGNQVICFDSDGIVFYYTSTANTGFAIITANKIDVTDYDTLYIKGLINSIVATTGQYVVRFGIANSISGYQPSYAQSLILTTVSAVEQTIEVDISGYTGEYYVALSGWGIDAEVHEIGLKNR